MSGEFGFELQVCQWAEHHWPPDRARENGILVARQLGTRHRRWDTVIIECDPDGLAARSQFGAKQLDSDLLEVVRHAPPEWEWYRNALPEPAYPWRYVRETVNRATDRGLIDRRNGPGGRVQIRRRFVYPDWVRRIIAIENKPDLDASAARRLQSQIQQDIALALADEVWIATEATAHRIEPALLEDVPVEAGILTVQRESRGPDTATVAWQPRTLPVEQPGTRILDRPDGGDHSLSACQFEYADSDWKATKRLQIAERAYERGWRSYVRTMCHDCRHFELRPEKAVSRPFCAAKDIAQTPRECSRSCEAFEPEPPTWRQRGWPIDGGPGVAIKRLLRRQRRRHRPDLSD